MTEMTKTPTQTPAAGMMTNVGSSFMLPSDASTTTGLSGAIAKAAGNAPIPGSVTQSSDGTNAVSDDTVRVDVTSVNGQLMYEGFYNGRSIVSTDRGQAAADVELIRDRAKGTELFERISAADWNGVEFYRSLRAGEAEAGSVAGNLWVDVYTDYEGTNDTDYLAGGIWVFAPDTATSLADYEFGAFVDGNDPFAQSALPALTGTATYEGEATGVYSDQTVGRNYFFDALASLTANFGTNSGLGTIDGRIHTFEEGGEPVEGNPVLTLGTANITNTNHGFFNSSTTMTFDGDDYTGKWGGQFYSNGESDGKPGSVAGTFGGATADDNYSFLGVFGAYKE
jgi:hypothetical protein